MVLLEIRVIGFRFVNYWIRIYYFEKKVKGFLGNIIIKWDFRGRGYNVYVNFFDKCLRNF